MVVRKMAPIQKRHWVEGLIFAARVQLTSLGVWNQLKREFAVTLRWSNNAEIEHELEFGFDDPPNGGSGKIEKARQCGCVERQWAWRLHREESDGWGWRIYVKLQSTGVKSRTMETNVWLDYPYWSDKGKCGKGRDGAPQRRQKQEWNVCVNHVRAQVRSNHTFRWRNRVQRVGTGGIGPLWFKTQNVTV